jgi:nucleoside-triphosphatase THEP1
MIKSKILILTGSTGTGKTRTLEKLIDGFGKSNIRFGGILAPGRYLESGQKEFELILVPGRQRFPLSTRIPYPGWQPVGGFRFNPEALEKGLEHLQQLPGMQYQLFLLDEIGPFELEGHVWADAVPALLDTGIPMIWTVRSSLLDKVCKKWDLADPLIVRVKKDHEDENIKEIKAWLEKNIPESS